MNKNIVILNNMLSCCELCPRRCKVNRIKGEKGFCRANKDVEISSSTLHFGEEPPISGTKGSGTIFFTHCSLRCVFCQNYPISHLGYGNKITLEKLSKIMINLQDQGAHNINLVTPTHYSAQIAEAISNARGQGLSIPIVYNCGGYELPEIIGLLEGLIDIYMPDAKYGDDKIAFKYSGVSDYVSMNQKSIYSMYKQVGNLVLDDKGIAKRGVLVRHLMLPANVPNTLKVLDFLASISKDLYISFMSQYYPAYKYYKYPELKRKLTKKEYETGLKYLKKLKLNNGWRQEL